MVMILRIIVTEVAREYKNELFINGHHLYRQRTPTGAIEYANHL